MLTDFYVAFATVCFTLLGLWIIVVQTRHGEWRPSPKPAIACVIAVAVPAPKLAANSSSRSSRPVNVRSASTERSRLGEHLESAVPLDRIQTPPRQ